MGYYCDPQVGTRNVIGWLKVFKQNNFSRKNIGDMFEYLAGKSRAGKGNAVRLLGPENTNKRQLVELLCSFY
jgi:hypothetical protein